MDREETKLLPCPFCGKQPSSRWWGVSDQFDDGGYWDISCCGAFAHEDDEKSAAKIWNTRASPQAEPAAWADRNFGRWRTPHGEYANAEMVWRSKSAVAVIPLYTSPQAGGAGMMDREEMRSLDRLVDRLDRYITSDAGGLCREAASAIKALRASPQAGGAELDQPYWEFRRKVEQIAPEKTRKSTKFDEKYPHIKKKEYRILLS